MARWKWKFLLLVFVLSIGGFGTKVNGASEGEWIQLFNGQSLDGWKMKIRKHELGDNFGSTFRVEDGLLKVRYDGYDRFKQQFGHIFYKAPFSHYLLRVEYRFVGEQVAGGPGWAFRNSGVMIHSQQPEGMKIDQEFPASVEAQLLGGRGSGKRATANVCTPGTHIVMDGELVTRHCTRSSSKTYHGDQWVTVELVVRGNEVIRHIVEGETVLEYSKPQLDDAHSSLAKKQGGQMLEKGFIALQSESHPVDFRKVELLKLEEE